jgi:hypothetical protein
LVTVVVPGAWWVLLASILCGLLLGAALIAMHQRKMERNTESDRGHKL